MEKWAFELLNMMKFLCCFPLNVSVFTLSSIGGKKNTRLTPIFKSKTLLCQERTNTLYYYKSNKWHFLRIQLYSCMHGLGTVTDNDKLQPTRENAKSANSNSKTNNMFGKGRPEWEKKEKVRKGYYFICCLFVCFFRRIMNALKCVKNTKVV